MCIEVAPNTALKLPWKQKGGVVEIARTSGTSYLASNHALCCVVKMMHQPKQYNYTYSPTGIILI